MSSVLCKKPHGKDCEDKALRQAGAAVPVGHNTVLRVVLLGHLLSVLSSCFDQKSLDNSSVTELLGDVLKERPQEADGIDSVIVVDNVPQVGPDRLEKLKNVIHKIFSKFGKVTNDFYPEEDGKTKG